MENAIEIAASRRNILVESFRVLKYFRDVATPAVLCHKEQARTSKAHYLFPAITQERL